MANKIKRSEIAEEDLFKSIRDSAKKTIQTLDNMNKSLKKTASTIKSDLKGTTFGNSEQINKVNSALKEANKIKNESVKISKAKQQAEQNLAKSESELLRIERERIKNEREQLKTSIMLKKEKERELKVKERLVKANKRENSEYGKLVKNTRILKNQSKELAAQLLKLEQNGKKNSAEWIKLSRSYKEATNAARQGDQALKKIDSTVGDNFRNVGNYSGALNTLKSGFMQLIGVAGGIQVLRNAFGTVMDLDQSIADLTAVSGKSKEDLVDLTNQAKELGGTSKFTASEITNMQIELAKLGFSSDQILQSTKGVSTFAAATGAEIPEAAALAGSALRGFGMEAIEMERVVSVLGVATTKSGLDFSKLQTSLSKVAPVAASVGFSIEDTTALLGQLANSGFDASMMGTSLKNILLKLADSNGDLAKKIGKPVSSAEDLVDALNDLNNEGVNLAEVLELTDQRSVTAFQTFLKGKDKLITLRDSITDVNDELQDMADKKLDSVRGQLTLLGSAWDNYIQGLNESIFASEGVKEFLTWLTDNLPSILNFVFKLGRAFVGYKIAVAAATLITKAYNLGLKGSITSLVGMARGTNAAAGATTRLGRAMKAVPWMLIIGFAFELAQRLFDAGDAADRLAEKQRKLKEQQREFNAQQQLKNQKLKNALQKEEIEIEKQLASGTITTEQALKKKDAAVKELIKSLKDEMSSEKDLKKLQDQKNAELSKINYVRRPDPNQGGVDKFFFGTDYITEDANDRAAQRNADNINQVIVKSKEVNKVNAETIKQLESITDQYDIQLRGIERRKNEEKKTGRNTKHTFRSTKKVTTELRTQVNLYRDINKIIREQANILNTIAQVEQDQKVSLIDENIENEFNIQMDNAKELGQFKLDNLRKLVEERRKLEIEGVERDSRKERIRIKTDFNQKYQDLRDNLKRERDELLKQEGVGKKERIKINDDYRTKMKLLGEKMKVDKEMTDDKLVLLEKQKVQKINEINKTANGELKNMDEELTDSKKEHDKQEEDDEKQKQDDKLKKEKEAADHRKQIASMLTDFLIKQSNERIALIDKEIAAANKQADHLRTLAQNGNIEAKESLAEQNRLIAEANIRKEQELKRQQRIKLAESVYSTYNQKVGEGVKNPLADTIRDTTMLQAFINSLPTFADGIEDTGNNGRGLDGKGGFLSILHPNERVVPKEENKLIGDLSNKDLARVVNEYNTGKLIGEGATQLGVGFQSQLIVKHLIKVQNAIENRPETNIELEKIVDGALTIAKQTKKGNSITYNRYKIR
ncbi:MAG: putative minor tail protein [Prokaryotic dsDNA virus sp.]|nr:MAG: putative minor tail protein [Prokaryotic dsDNA virus sp.]